MADRDINKLNPVFLLKVKLFLQEVGEEIFITEAVRTAERQAELYAQGRTTPGNIVTWVTHSNHQDGLAIDIAFKGDDLYPKERKKWEDLSIKATEYGIDCGLKLWDKDFVHFQDNGQPYTYNGVPVVFANKCSSKTANACYMGSEKVIYLQDKFFTKSKRLADSILEHEYAHHVLIYKVPYMYQKLWKKISEFHWSIKAVTKYKENAYITDYAKKNFAEDFSECVEAMYINPTKKYEGYLGAKMKIVKLIYNRYK